MRQLLAILACSLVASATFSGEQENAFRLSTQLQDGWVIDVAPELPAYSVSMFNGKQQLQFDAVGSLEPGDPTGAPMLPLTAITFGIPAGTHLRVELKEAMYDTQTSQIVAPHPTYTVDDSQRVHAEYKPDAAVYSQNRLFPERQFVADKPMLLRDQLTATVRLSLFQYNPAAQILIRLVRAKLHVALVTSSGAAAMLPGATAPVSDPLFESTYKSVIWNYDQAKGWRVREEDHSAVTPLDSTRNWFQTGRAYYRALVAEDGWHRVTKAQLLAAGTSGGAIDVPSLKVFSRGIEVPCILWPDTTIEFYGVMNHGDTSYYDFYTDTSTYWVTWGGDAGKRYSIAPVDPLPPTEIVNSGRTTKHVEQNNYYYVGASDPELVEFETVVGEGWAWGEANTWFYPNQMKNFSFWLDDLDTLGIQQATLRARLVGTTVSPFYHARFWINQPEVPREVDIVGEVRFPQRTSAIMATSFAHEMLRRGENTLRVHSFVPPSVNQFYLDWFEVEYNRELITSNNRILFSTPPQTTLVRTQFRVAGFTSPDIEAYDVTNYRRISGTVQGSGSYTFLFTDTVRTTRKYVVVARNGVASVPSLEQKFFKDIRVNAQGADYIIIAHRDFLSAAQQLATYRQAHNAIRAKVIDVQDVYDEFNYGTLNAVKIKTFLKHTYDTWPTPRPAAVLMFGDASWDYHRYLATSRFTNFVPSYGVPACDLWFVAFRPDTTIFPSMFIGRVPVKTPIEAEQTAEKLISYESYTLGDWNKEYLFISGRGFASISDEIISARITPAPLGGTPFRVVKTSNAAIDGEHKATMKSIVNRGVVVVNFIGHSGGRVWEVDIGPIGDLENTNGKLPFVGSVSCNVAAFADPASFVLTEDWLLTPGKGGIGCWATSGLGYPDLGKELLLNFFQGVRDTVRLLGALTTNAKIRYLRTNGGSDFRQRSTVALNTLIGDPLTAIAIATKPDLAVNTEDIAVDIAQPTPADSVVQLKTKLHNYGLVPADSVRVRVNDIYNGQSSMISDVKRPPTRQLDSVTVQWRGTQQVGPHALSMALDPLNTIPEVSEINNIASSSQYVYANYLSIVKPIDNLLVPPGAQQLVVSRPIGVDTSGFSYEFQVDTIETFDSPFLIQSGPITPGPVSGEWLTPSLPVGQLFFWRARTVYPAFAGRWVVGCFTTSNALPPAPLVRWRENSSKQFRREKLAQASATDSGVTIAVIPPIRLFVRSISYHIDYLAEYYSIVRVNEVFLRGFPPDAGSGFMVARINDFTGVADLQTFDNSIFGSTGRANANRFAGFINQTPVGNFIAFATVYDGGSNITDSLRNALQQLGSTRVGQFQYGQGWVFVGRKGVNGPGMTPIEFLQSDSATINYEILNYYGMRNGSLSTRGLSIPTSWDSFHWRWHGVAATNARVAFLGTRQNGVIDTLRILPRDSTDVSLAFLNPLTSGGTYKRVHTASLLNTTDALVTPTLTDWWLDFTPAPDLAVSARLLEIDASGENLNVEVKVHNLGYQTSDSASVVISAYDQMNRARQLTSVPISAVRVGGEFVVRVPIGIASLPQRTTLQVEVVPLSKEKDLVEANNIAYYAFTNSARSSRLGIRVLVDGVEILDGDYISPEPTIQVRPQHAENIAVSSIALAVDNSPMISQLSQFAAKGDFGRLASSETEFKPQLANGSHQLKFFVTRTSETGDVDSTEHVLQVNVLTESRLLNVMNYPNPFARETFFTFMMSGMSAPDEITIRIFTIAGRKVREIRIPSHDLRLGFNRVQWDGRDEDGDEIANGYYLYQIAMKGNQKSDSAIQKLTKVR
ncbi:MAG: hypothetical protein HY961_11455 [Ignavibacteriae bacterium]|nr:hypothetical protein [Ignavibacteriota bacterium]